MSEIPEIPKYIKYDFLITLLGLICLGSAWYFSSVARLDQNSTAFLWIMGGVLAIWGLIEMYNNYSDEQDLRQLNQIIEEKEAFNKILKKKIISKDFVVDFNKYLKNEFKDIFQKSKDRKKKSKSNKYD